jgi:hydrogenase maturation protease
MIIGVGNAYRGDDAVGQVVAQRLREEPLNHVTVLVQDSAGADLLESWRDTDVVMLIDAVQSGARPGTVHCIEATERPVPKTLRHCSTHAFGVGAAIELARVLQQLPPRLVIYGIEGQTFDMGAGLSEAVAQTVPEVLARMRHDVYTLQAAQEHGRSYA